MACRHPHIQLWCSWWLWAAPWHTWHPACQCTPLGHCFAHWHALHVPTLAPCAVGPWGGKWPKWHFVALSTMQCSGCCSTVWAPMATHPPSTCPVGANQRPWGAYWAPPPHTAAVAPQPPSHTQHALSTNHLAWCPNGPLMQGQPLVAFFLQELACTALLQKSHHNWWQILLVLSGETGFLCTRACPTQRPIAMCTLVGHGKHTAPSSPPAKPRKGSVVVFSLPPVGFPTSAAWWLCCTCAGAAMVQ